MVKWNSCDSFVNLKQSRIPGEESSQEFYLGLVVQIIFVYVSVEDRPDHVN